jgi:hypothetical protein
MAPAEQSAWNLALFLWKRGVLLTKRKRRLVTAFKIRTIVIEQTS